MPRPASALDALYLNQEWGAAQNNRGSSNPIISKWEQESGAEWLSPQSPVDSTNNLSNSEDPKIQSPISQSWVREFKSQPDCIPNGILVPSYSDH